MCADDHLPSPHTSRCGRQGRRSRTWALELSPYHAAWPRWFAQERDNLLTYVPEIIEVEHIGSTSIPGLIAKPLIDMQASLRAMRDADAAIRRLLRLGYTYMPERVYEERIFLPKGPEAERTHHLSLIEAGTTEWGLRPRFRDALRADTALRDQYQALKRRLLAEHAGDRAAYTDAKTAFVTRVLAGRPE